jgi:hypothetical protein
MSDRTKHLSRRNFLLAVGAGSAAGAAAIMTKTPAPVAPTTGKDKRATRGYQATEHVSNYYRTAKV